MKVFLDTSGLFAMLVKNDGMHLRGRATFERLVELGAEFCTTSYVLLETLALLQARVGLDAARLFHHQFLPIIDVHYVTEELHEKAFRRLELRGRRELSLVDCASFVYMEEARVSRVLAYDKHFAEEGFTLYETPDDVDGKDTGRWIKST